MGGKGTLGFSTLIVLIALSLLVGCSDNPNSPPLSKEVKEQIVGDFCERSHEIIAQLNLDEGSYTKASFSFSFGEEKMRPDEDLSRYIGYGSQVIGTCEVSGGLEISDLSRDDPGEGSIDIVATVTDDRLPAKKVTIEMYGNIADDPLSFRLDGSVVELVFGT